MSNNMGIVTKEQLTYIDQTVYDPQVAPLTALNIFSTFPTPEANDYLIAVKHIKLMLYLFPAVVIVGNLDAQCCTTEYLLSPPPYNRHKR